MCQDIVPPPHCHWKMDYFTDHMPIFILHTVQLQSCPAESTVLLTSEINFDSDTVSFMTVYERHFHAGPGRTAQPAATHHRGDDSVVRIASARSSSFHALITALGKGSEGSARAKCR